MGIIAFFGASFFPAVAADWTMARFDQAQTGYTEEKIDLPLSLSWQYNAPRYKSNTSTPAVYNGTVYFCSGDRLYAADAQSGALKWKYPAEEALGGMVKTSVTISDGLVFFGATDKNLYAVDAETGKYVWAYSTSGSIKSSPMVSEGVVYCGSDDNCLYAINVQTGESVWTSGFKTEDDVSCSPAIGQSIVVFASKDTKIYAASAASGKTRWMYRLPMALNTTSVVIGDNAVFVPAGGLIQVLTIGSGQVRGTIKLEADVAATPVVVGKDLYVVCKNKKMYAFDCSLKQAKAKWAQGVDLSVACTAPPTVAGDLIFVPGSGGVISAFSIADGTLKWRYKIMPTRSGQAMESTEIATSPVVSNGALYVLTDDGAMHCFRTDASDDYAPEVANVEPQVGSSMNGSPPIDITAGISDLGSGIDESSIQVSIDGTAVEHTYDFAKSLVKYQTPATQPIRPLREGPHEITLAAKDWKGNKLETKWSFIVDNTMRPRVVPKASGGKVKTEPKGRPTMPSRPGFPTPPAWRRLSAYSTASSASAPLRVGCAGTRTILNCRVHKNAWNPMRYDRI